MRPSPVLAASALVASLVAAGVLAFAGIYTSELCTTTASGGTDCVSRSTTLVEENGWRMLAPLAGAIAISAGALASVVHSLPRSAVWAFAALAFAGCLVSLASFGVFFLPTALLILGAAATDRRAAAS